MIKLATVLGASWGIVYLLLSSALLAPVRHLVWRVRSLRPILFPLHCAICGSFWAGALTSVVPELRLVEGTWWWQAVLHALIVLGLTKAAVGKIITFPLDSWIESYGIPEEPTDASAPEEV